MMLLTADFSRFGSVSLEQSESLQELIKEKKNCSQQWVVPNRDANVSAWLLRIVKFIGIWIQFIYLEHREVVTCCFCSSINLCCRSSGTSAGSTCNGLANMFNCVCWLLHFLRPLTKCSKEFYFTYESRVEKLVWYLGAWQSALRGTWSCLQWVSLSSTTCFPLISINCFNVFPQFVKQHEHVAVIQPLLLTMVNQISVLRLKLYRHLFYVWCMTELHATESVSSNLRLRQHFSIFWSLQQIPFATAVAPSVTRSFFKW